MDEYEYFPEENEDENDDWVTKESKARKKKSRKKIVVDLGEGRESLTIEEEGRYTPGELDLMADEILRAHSRSIDPDTGRPIGIGASPPILFEEHVYSRKRREIYNQNGVPDPNIVSGIYWRTHPQGRKVTTAEQRKKNGASWYR
jgi:hypothetical protein